MTIFKSDEYFEAKATVAYANPTLGMGLAFRDVKSDFRIVMQKWLLLAAPSRRSHAHSFVRFDVSDNRAGGTGSV